MDLSLGTELRNTLIQLEWSRRFCFAGTLVMVIGFIWLAIFLFQRFHIGLFLLFCLSVAEFCIVIVLIPVIYYPYSKSFKNKIISSFIDPKSSKLSLFQNEEIDRIDFMSSQFFLKTPNYVWCNMVMKGRVKENDIRCGMIKITSTERNSQSGNFDTQLFSGLFVIITPESSRDRISCVEPNVLVVPADEPYYQDASYLSMATSDDSSYLNYNATKPIPNGSTHSLYASKIPDQSLCIPPKQIRIVRKKAEQVIYEDSLFNDAFTVYCKDSDSRHKSIDLKFKQLLLTAKERNGKAFYFSKFDNVVFAAFERDKDDFKPPLFVPINEKIVGKLDSAYQKTVEEINKIVEIAEYLK